MLIDSNAITTVGYVFQPHERHA